MCCWVYKISITSQGSIDSVPAGTILPWYGNISTLPIGYAYCDGSNGTPDLRGRTIVGTGLWNDDVDSVTYPLGGIGGERLHRLTIAEMPIHNHGVPNYFFVGPQKSGGGGPGHEGDPYPIHPSTGATAGGDLPHNNMPPFMALHWIMKR